MYLRIIKIFNVNYYLKTIKILKLLQIQKICEKCTGGAENFAKKFFNLKNS